MISALLPLAADPGWTVQNTINLVQQIAVPVVAALLSFAGVVVALETRRRADVRAERDQRMLTALNELRDMARSILEPPASPFADLEAALAASWHFDWAISRKQDAPVGDWFSQRVLRLLRIREADWPPAGKVMDATIEVQETLNELNRWRLGERKPKWFADEALRLDELSEKPLERRGNLTVEVELTETGTADDGA